MSEKTVYVGNFPYETTEDTLRCLFNSCGNIRYVRIICDQETHASKGYAFCKFKSEKSAKYAVENLDGVDFNGRKLRICLAHDPQH